MGKLSRSKQGLTSRGPLLVQPYQAESNEKRNNYSFMGKYTPLRIVITQRLWVLEMPMMEVPGALVHKTGNFGR